MLNTVRNLTDLGSGEELATITEEVRKLADQTTLLEDKLMKIDTLEQDNTCRAQLLRELLEHTEQQDVELNRAVVD